MIDPMIQALLMRDFIEGLEELTFLYVSVVVLYFVGRTVIEEVVSG